MADRHLDTDHAGDDWDTPVYRVTEDARGDEPPGGPGPSPDPSAQKPQDPDHAKTSGGGQLRRPAIDPYVLYRLMSGQPLDIELGRASSAVQRLAIRLARFTDMGIRRGILEGFLTALEDGDEVFEAMNSIDPQAGPPEDKPITPATLVHIRRLRSSVQWHWKGCIPAARLVGLASFEGVGKTRFFMDLAHRIYFAMPWPDGQPATFPAGTRTLWVCADGQQDELADLAAAMGLSDEAVVFNATDEEPYSGTEIDTKEDRERLETIARQVRPGLIVIDTLTNATSYDVCRATENKALMTPLRDLAQRLQLTIVVLLHLSREGHVLGRRVRGIVRTILQLDCPDQEQSERLRLQVVKSFAKKPPALGVTMGDAGNTYDSNPPDPAESRPFRAGRPRVARGRLERFLREALSREDGRLYTELKKEWTNLRGSESTFGRGISELVEEGVLRKTGGKRTGAPMRLYRIEQREGDLNFGDEE